MSRRKRKVDRDDIARVYELDGSLRIIRFQPGSAVIRWTWVMTEAERMLFRAQEQKEKNDGQRDSTVEMEAARAVAPTKA